MLSKGDRVKMVGRSDIIPSMSWPKIGSEHECMGTIIKIREAKYGTRFYATIEWDNEMIASRIPIEILREVNLKDKLNKHYAI